MMLTTSIDTTQPGTGWSRTPTGTRMNRWITRTRTTRTPITGTHIDRLSSLTTFQPRRVENGN